MVSDFINVDAFHRHKRNYCL